MKRILMIIGLTVIFFTTAVAQDDIDLTEGEDTNINKPMVNISDLKRIQDVMAEAGEKDNTLEVPYKKFATYKIRCRTAMDTYIHLPQGEVISYAKFGDEANFKFTPILDENDVRTNIGVIEVLFAGADTNLTIIGESGNIYNFYVRVDNHESPEIPHNLVVVKDSKFIEKIKPRPKKGKSANNQRAIVGEKDESIKGEKISFKREEKVSNKEIGDYLKKIDNVPLNMLYTSQSLDFRYVIYKLKNLLAPIQIFDDGEWTYFKLTPKKNLNGLKDFPVLFEVVDGIEQPTNTRTIRNYIIAEKISDNWALRVGERFICIKKQLKDEATFPN